MIAVTCVLYSKGTHEVKMGCSRVSECLKLKQLNMDDLLNMDFEDFQAWLDAGGDYIRPAAVAPVVHPDGAGGDAGDHFVAPVAPAVHVAPPPVALPLWLLQSLWLMWLLWSPPCSPCGSSEDHAYAAALALWFLRLPLL
ncbi:hypothetical protein WMY93_024359 [Mugilogobius chulae]|uniref:Uncharacterized protein n=1 Tax=Mugilogobius chulae TaxID=88201 RepID=A0AAW0N502_9GOBI